jgi:hypothetical protein
MKLRISNNHLRKFLREGLGMSYKVLGLISTRHNKQENLLMRQLAAHEYIKVLESGKLTVNIDESVIRQSD